MFCSIILFCYPCLDQKQLILIQSQSDTKINKKCRTKGKQGCFKLLCVDFSVFPSCHENSETNERTKSGAGGSCAEKEPGVFFFKLPALQDQGSVASGDTYQVHFAFLTTAITAMWFEVTRNRSGRRVLHKVELFFS